MSCPSRWVPCGGSRTGPSRAALTLRPGNNRTSDASREHIISSCWPIRKGRTKKIGDEHKGEAERCVENLFLRHMMPRTYQNYIISGLLGVIATNREHVSSRAAIPERSKCCHTRELHFGRVG
jgi:hypothetical protein